MRCSPFLATRAPDSSPTTAQSPSAHPASRNHRWRPRRRDPPRKSPTACARHGDGHCGLRPTLTCRWGPQWLLSRLGRHCVSRVRPSAVSALPTLPVQPMPVSRDTRRFQLFLDEPPEPLQLAHRSISPSRLPREGGGATNRSGSSTTVSSGIASRPPIIPASPAPHRHRASEMHGAGASTFTRHVVGRHVPSFWTLARASNNPPNHVSLLCRAMVAQCLPPSMQPEESCTAGSLAREVVIWSSGV